MLDVNVLAQLARPSPVAELSCRMRRRPIGVSVDGYFLKPLLQLISLALHVTNGYEGRDESR